MSSKNLIKVLINASEKAANIARKCRADISLLSLLIQEKSADEANPRFVQDFKTLADVLIQETVRNDVAKMFPEIRDNIKGEESATFTNKLGDSISVVIGDGPDKTAACLERVLDGNRVAGEILAHEVHENIDYPNTGTEIPDLPEDIDYSKIGIWIDPIDGTAEYIAGDTIFSSFPGITSTGLDCVTILIGAFNIETGVPIIGVINQPFHSKIDVNSYSSKVFWGISLDNLKVNNLMRTESPIALFSSSEHRDVIELVKSLNYEIAFSAGAGHKALKVITGEASLYLLTKPTTFKWDTCAPHAILKSLGGGIFNFRESINSGCLVSITYDANSENCHDGGIIVMQNIGLFHDLFEILSD